MNRQPSRRMTLHRLAGCGLGLGTLGLGGLGLGGLSLGVPAWAQAGSWRTITWDELVPKDWDPSGGLKDKPVGLIREGSAAELALMRELRELWDRAPTRADLAGQRVRLPGYVVPLEQAEGKLSEFLLVPYFGACIHSPPPPANQIVHVAVKTPVAARTMDVVWVAGTLTTERRDSVMGVSGYGLAAEKVEAYRSERR